MTWSKINRIFVFCIVLVTHFASVSQNPFDIKKPTPNAPASVVKKVNPVKTIDSNSIKVSTTKRPEAITKPEAGKSDSGSVSNLVTPPAEVDTKMAISPAANAKPSSGLDQANNPFNIIAPVGAPPQPINKSIPATETTTTTGPVTTGVAEIKEKVNNFKKATTTEGRSISKNAWFVVYIFLFLMAAIAINFNRSYPVSLIKATYNQNQLRALFKDAFKGNHMMIFGILYFIFVINAGIFTYLSFKTFDVAPLSLFMAILIILAVYLIRHLVMMVLAQVFPLEKEASFFSFTIGIHNLALGLALMLINICLSFVDEESGKILIFSGLSLILLFYTLRQIRGLLNNIPTIVSGKFHFIIYLCTVEIAPWILLAGILLK